MVVQCFFTIEKKGRSIIGFLRIFPSSQLVFPLSQPGSDGPSPGEVVEVGAVGVLQHYYIILYIYYIIV
jgi:hypothetical protein